MSASAEEMRRRQQQSRALVPVAPPAVQLASTSMTPYAPPPRQFAPTSLVPAAPQTGMVAQPQQTRAMVPTAAQRLAAPAAAPVAAPSGPTIAVGANGVASVGGVQPRAAGQPPPRPTMYGNTAGVVSPVPPPSPVQAGGRLPPGVTGPFDPTPTRSAAAALGAAPAQPAATGAPGAAPAAVAPTGAVGNAAARVRPAGLRTGGALALGLEGLNVAGAGMEGGVGAAAQEAVGAGGRLGATALGATAAQRLASMVPLPGRYGTALQAAAPIVGGAVGYAAGASGVDRIERALGGRPTAEQVAAMGRANGGLVPNPVDANGNEVPSYQWRNVQAGVRGGNNTAQPSSATDGGNEAARSLGTFTGSDGVERNITSGEADRLASQVTTVPAGQQPTAAQRLAAPTVAGPNRFLEGERTNYVRQLDTQIQNIGPLDRRSRRQLVGELLGLKGRSIDGAMGLSARQGETQASLAQRTAADQLSADVNREQIDAQSQNQRRQNTQLITAADGSTYAVEGTTLTPVSAADGSTFRQAVKTDDSQQKIAADMLSNLVMPGDGAEQIAAKVEQARSAAAALAAPAGAAGAGAAPQSKAQFIAAAKASNQNATDAELGAYYEQTYGK